MASHEELERILRIRRRIDVDPSADKSDLWLQIFRAADKAREGTNYSIDEIYEAIEKQYIEMRKTDARHAKEQERSLLQSPPDFGNYPTSG